MPAPISNISDTARWIAAYRAMESERPDAIFRDPFARRLAGEQGERIVDALPGGRMGAWALTVRTAVLDEIVMRAVRELGVDTVVNLACGLDTRPYRLPLPAETAWVEVDLPGILDYKESKLSGERPICRLERIKLDLSDERSREELFARIGASSRKALIVTEGLLCYLTEGQVASLGRALARQPSFRYWVTDLFSPELLRWLNRSWGRALAEAGAPFLFAPERGTGFFGPLGWKLLEERSSIEDAARLNRRPPLGRLSGWVLAFFPARRRRLRRMSRIVLFNSDS